jgi:hypothetical protein
VVRDNGMAPDTSALAHLPPTMAGRPFRSDESGRAVGRTKGSFIRATVEYMLECVAERTVAASPSPGEVDASKRADQITGAMAQAKAAALEELLKRLNAATPDPRYHVTVDYLMNEGHSGADRPAGRKGAAGSPDHPGRTIVKRAPGLRYFAMILMRSQLVVYQKLRNTTETHYIFVFLSQQYLHFPEAFAPANFVDVF